MKQHKQNKGVQKMSEKKYYGNGKQITGQYGSFLKLSFNRDDLQHMLDNVNEKGWINLNVNERQSPSEWGHTHSISLDTYKPAQAPQGPLESFNQPQTPAAADIPF